MLIWPWEQAEAVVERWLEMLPDLPEEFTTTCAHWCRCRRSRRSPSSCAAASS